MKATIKKREKNQTKLIQKNKLSEMLKQINRKNIHKEVETGRPVGKEI